jgi:catechol 2,3-dioxygenase-like lactoylglutathione lyase family enzyme
MKLTSTAFLVRDYDEAIAWFVSVLGFELREDTALSSQKRWVRVAAPGQHESLLLARAEGDDQQSAIGRAAGGRVAYFLNVENFKASHTTMQAKGVTFLENPRHEAYGTVAVFKDLYGNRWDLIGPPSLE